MCHRFRISRRSCFSSDTNYTFCGDGQKPPMTDLIQFRSLTPHLLTAETLGSGHFSPLFVPDQINAMLSTFVELY